MSKYDISPGTLFEDFEDSTEWSVSNGTVSNDTTFVKTGTKSLKLTANSGAAGLANKTISASFLSAGCLYVWVYIPTMTGVSSVFVYVGSNSSVTTKSFNYGWGSSLHEGWNRLQIGRNMWTNTGSEDWSNTMIRIGVRINATGGQTPTIYFDSLYIQYDARPKLILSADDGWDTQYTKMYPYLQKYGFKGSLYIIQDLVNTSGYMTTAQLQTLFDEGWDIMNHTKTHSVLTSLTPAEIRGELTNCRDYIRENGWDRRNSALHVAYPTGAYNDDVITAMGATGMINGRTTKNRVQAHEIDSEYRLTRQSHDYTASQATYQGWIDQLIASKGSLELNYHKIEDSGSNADTEVNLSQFQDLIDYVASKGNKLDVVTKTEWCRGLTNARKIR